MSIEEIADFLGAHFGAPLLDGEYINIRLIDPPQPAINQFFKTPEAAAAYALKMKDERSVYFGVNPRHLNNATKEGVTRIVTLHGDFDVGEDKPFATKEAGYEALLALPIAPSFIVDSGGGLHAYWKLNPLEATRENIERVERNMGRLYKMLGGADRVQDVSRVLRVPGTTNHKRGAEVRILYGRA